MQLFELFGVISLKDGDADKKISSIDNNAKALDGKLNGMIKTVGKWGLAIGAGAAAAGTALLGVAKNAADTTDRIDKMSQKLGFSREAFQEWDYILSQNGASIDSLGAGMKTLTNQVDELGKGGKVATDAFSELGMEYEDLEGLTQEEIFEKTVVALQGLEDKTKRAALANDLLGKSGQELAPLLNAGTDSVDNLKEKAHELGMVLSDEAIDSGVQFTDALDTMKRSAGALFTQIGSELMPVFIELFNKVSENMPLIKEKIDEGITFALDIFDKLKKSIEIVKENADTLIPVIGGIVSAFAALKIITSVTAGFAKLKALMVALKASTIALTYAQGGLSAVMAANPIGVVVVSIGALIAAGIALYRNWDTVTQKAKLFWENLKRVFEDIENKVVGVVNGMISSAKTWATNMIDMFIDGIKSKINAVGDAVKGVANKIKDFLGFSSPTKEGPGKDADKWAPNFMDMFAEGINENRPLVEDAVNKVADSVKNGFDNAMSHAQSTVDRLRSMYNEVSRGVFDTSSGGGSSSRGKKSYYNSETDTHYIVDDDDGTTTVIDGDGNTRVIDNNDKGTADERKDAKERFEDEYGYEPDSGIIDDLVRNGYATGTDYARAGLALVGERGPELVDFNGGEKVYTNEQSMGMLGRVTNQFNISQMVVREEADIKKIARELYNLQKSTSRGVGIV